MASQSKTTTNHDQIRRWAEARHAQPARVKGTGSRGRDPGMIRLAFPGYSGRGKLEPISWDQWFKSFDDNDLALVYQEKTAGGQRSNFNKLVARETARARARGNSHASRRKGTSGSSRSSASRSPRRKSTSRSRSGTRGGTSARRSGGSRSTGRRSRSSSSHGSKRSSSRSRS
jgi:hypothetical protein